MQNNVVVHVAIFNCEFYRQLGSFPKNRACFSSPKSKTVPSSKQASGIRNSIIMLVACSLSTEEARGLEIFWKECIKLETGPL